MLRIAICDDDMVFAGSLETTVIQECQILRISVETEVFSDGDTLVGDMEKGSCYDIIFLDIEMERVNGIVAAHSIRRMDRTVLLIYISGYEQYLKELFEVEPFRFLSKPVNQKLFSQYFKDACQRITDTSAYYQFAFNKEIKRVLVRDIIYFESQNRVIHIFLKDGFDEQFYGKLNDVETELVERRQRFLRIHQSYLVNYDYIRQMNFSSLIISMGNKNDIMLKISEDRQKAVREQLIKTARGKADTR